MEALPNSCDYVSGFELKHELRQRQLRIFEKFHSLNGDDAELEFHMIPAEDTIEDQCLLQICLKIIT